jgi:uridylate kinase
MLNNSSPIVISVGGSLIVPNGGINIDFLIKFNNLIRTEVIKGKHFLLIAGGGKLCRHYQEAGRAVIGNLTQEDLDWLGIHVTHLNGQLLRTIFQDIANPRVIQHYDRKLKNWKEPIAIGAGWKPGWTTDYDAVQLAKDYGGKLIINMSNIDFVYDKDPAKYPEAKPLKKISWNEMSKIVGEKHSSGINAPFDPIATKLAKKLKLTVVIANGNNLKNIQKIINQEPFEGTVISNNDS